MLPPLELRRLDHRLAGMRSASDDLVEALHRIDGLQLPCIPARNFDMTESLANRATAACRNRIAALRPGFLL
jgi:hypothetical protein